MTSVVYWSPPSISQHCRATDHWEITLTVPDSQSDSRFDLNWRVPVLGTSCGSPKQMIRQQEGQAACTVSTACPFSAGCTSFVPNVFNRVNWSMLKRRCVGGSRELKKSITISFSHCRHFWLQWYFGLACVVNQVNQVQRSTIDRLWLGVPWFGARFIATFYSESDKIRIRMQFGQSSSCIGLAASHNVCVSSLGIRKHTGCIVIYLFLKNMKHHSEYCGLRTS